MIPIGSSELWGSQATARLHKLVVDSNDGVLQCVMENHTDLLDLMTTEQLNQYEELGLSIAYLAIHHDQPDILRYLHRRGVDLSLPCDHMGFGTPMFYAVALGRTRLIETLFSLGYSVNKACETSFNRLPIYYANRREDIYTQEKLIDIAGREGRALNLLTKNILKLQQLRRYKKVIRAVIRIQAVGRSYLSRRLVGMIRRGDIKYRSGITNLLGKEIQFDDSSTDDDEESVEENESGNEEGEEDGQDELNDDDNEDGEDGG